MISMVVLHIILKQTEIVPFFYLHTIFIVMVWLILYQATPRVLWIALLPLLVLELFSATPFGLNSLALLITLSLLSWLLLTVFTNHSWPTVGLAGLIGMLFYRLLLFGIVKIFVRNSGFEITKDIIFEWVLESVITAVALVIWYGITTRFVKRLRPQYVRV